jgi:hypothetical protein
VPGYDELDAEEIVALLGSLERDDLVALRSHEQAGRDRQGVVRAIDSLLARAPV